MQLKAVWAGKLLPFVTLLLPGSTPKKENWETLLEGYQHVPPKTNIDPHSTWTKSTWRVSTPQDFEEVSGWRVREGLGRRYGA